MHRTSGIDDTYSAASRLHVAALEYKKLTTDALCHLDTFRIQHDGAETRSQLIRCHAAHPFEDIAVIDKCNAVIVTATTTVDTDDQFARAGLLSAWAELAPRASAYISKTDYYAGREAIRYLGEVSVGLRSVVLGDSQVHAQVIDGLGEASGAGINSSPFTALIRNLKVLAKDVRNSTTLQSGNVSLERLGCERVTSQFGAESATVAVIGLGRSGRLMMNILAKETKHRLIVANRTPVRIDSRAHPAVEVIAWNDLSFVDRADAVILCLSSNSETRKFARRLAERIDPAAAEQQLFLDMSSPSISQDLPVEFVRLDQLANDAKAGLSTRSRAINKVRQTIADWVPVVERQLDSIARHHDRNTASVTVPPPINTELATGRSVMLEGIRRHLAQNGFLEIRSPVLVPAGTDPYTAGQFATEWKGSEMELRRASSMPNQMAILDGHDRVFEIGTSWNQNFEPSPCDSLESEILTAEVRDPVDLSEIYSLALTLINVTAERIEPLGNRGPLNLPNVDSTPVLGYDEAIDMLHRAGHSIAYGTSFGFDRRYFLGDLVKTEFGFDICVVRGHPRRHGQFFVAREDGAEHTQAFEILLGGWPVSAGALRESDATKIRKHMAVAGFHPAKFEFYLSRLDGAPPHGGFEVGLDRLLAKLLGYNSVRDVTSFPWMTG